MRLVAFDVETHKIQPGLLSPPIVCGAFAEPGLGGFVVPRKEAIDQLHLMLGTDTTLIGQNIAYDFGCVLAHAPELLPLVWKAYEDGRVHDIGIAATLNAIAEGRLKDGDLFLRDGSKAKGRYSLDLLVKEWLGRDNAKENARFRTSYALLEGIPIDQWPEDARQYPIDDVENTLKVAEAQLVEGACQNLQDLATQCHTAFCLHLGAMWGLRTDPEAVEKLARDTEDTLAALKREFEARGLYRVGGTKKEPKLVKDTKLLKELVTKAYLGQPPRTEKGAVATDRVTLEESHDAFLVQLSSVSKVEKIATYLPALREATTKPLNVRPNVLLSTGRSSYEGIIQLLPRKGGVRDCFVPRAGRYFSSVDYAAIELSTLAQVCLWTVGESRLADAINAGMDPHSLFAARMLEVPYEEFLADKDSRTSYADKRQAAKAANFGFPGMMGAATFVIAKRREGMKVCELTHSDGKCGEEKSLEWKGRPIDFPLCVRCLEEADSLRRYYLDQWPEVAAYWNWVSANMDSTDDSLEQFVSKRRRAGCTGPSGANTLFQGLAADGAKRAVIKLTEEMYLGHGALRGSRLVVFSHDETILEIPAERAHEAAYRQAKVMVDEMQKVVPDVKVSAEPALMERWYKEAKTVHDEAGKLIPWRPK